MNYSKKLWLWLGGIFIVSFAISLVKQLTEANRLAVWMYVNYLLLEHTRIKPIGSVALPIHLLAPQRIRLYRP